MIEEKGIADRRKSTRRCCVLIVDDDPDLREGLELTLQFWGHCVAAVADGIEALKRLRTRPPPGIVLLDLMMPGMNGFELRTVMKADPRLARIPVIVLTGAGVLLEGRSAELDADILRKPFELTVLLDLVAEKCADQPLS